MSVVYCFTVAYGNFCLTLVHDWSATTSTPSATLTIDGTVVSASSSVRDLGIHIDGDLVMRNHVQKTVALLRRPASVASNSSLSATAYVTVAGGHSGKHAARLWLRRLDRPPGLSYASSAVSPRGQSSTQPLQIFNSRRSDHVSDALISLHWLRVPERIRSKVAVLVYKVLHGCAPSYLGLFTYVADLPSRQGVRSSCSDCLV